MKKILTLVLSMMFLMGLMIAPVSAAAGDVAIDASDVTAKPGETVTLTFTASADDAVKFATYAFSFQYDATQLSYVEGSEGSVVFNPAYSANVAFATNAAAKDVYGNGSVLLSVQFTVNANAKPGDVYPVQLAIDNVRNANGEYLTTTAYNGSVTILCPGCVWDNGTVTTQPTCTVDGEMTYTCTLCGATKTEPIPALGHNWDNGKVTKAATCTEKGIMTYTCLNDASHTKSEDIDALGHKYDNGKVTKAATCTEKGVKTFTCTVCGDTYTESIDALGHKYDEGKVTKKPTCTEKGEMTFTCTVCGHSYTEPIDAHGHDWGPWEMVKKPTETEWGLEQRVCRICGEIETRDVEPAKDQVPDTGVRSNNYAWIAVAGVAGAAVAFVWKRKTAK